MASNLKKCKATRTASVQYELFFPAWLSIMHGGMVFVDSVKEMEHVKRNVVSATGSEDRKKP